MNTKIAYSIDQFRKTLETIAWDRLHLDKDKLHFEIRKYEEQADLSRKLSQAENRFFKDLTLVDAEKATEILKEIFA